MALATGLINKAYVYKKDEMSGKEMVMLVMPSLVSVTGYGILRYYMTIYEKDTGKSLMDHYGFFGILTFAHYLVSMIAILVMIVMFQNWKATQEEQCAQELMHSQVCDMQRHIGEVEKLYRDIRSMRHDIGVYSVKRCTEREYRKRILHELKEDNDKTDKTEKAQETNDVPKTDEAENNQAAVQPVVQPVTQQNAYMRIDIRL